MTCLFAALLGGCAAAPAPAAPRLLGVGTPGVLSYGDADGATDAADLLRRCNARAPETAGPPQPQTLDAACDQLRRSMHNQPGNDAPSG